MEKYYLVVVLDSAAVANPSLLSIHTPHHVATQHIFHPPTHVPDKLCHIYLEQT
jgi:hypothetical protein